MSLRALPGVIRPDKSLLLRLSLDLLLTWPAAQGQDIMSDRAVEEKGGPGSMAEAGIGWGDSEGGSIWALEGVPPVTVV